MAVAPERVIRQNIMMTLTHERTQAIDDFLACQGMGDASRRQIAGDASFRRYERITRPGGERPLVLMDAPPEKEDVRPFIAVQSCLHAAGYSVPEILAADESAGFLLLEDLGDDSFTRVLAQAPQQEEALYAAAIDALADLCHRGLAVAHASSLPTYSLELLKREVALLPEWFLPLVMGQERAEVAGKAFMGVMLSLLKASDLSPRVVVHRDFHADNLFWLADRSPAIRRVGMLDFQDAVLGRPAYDLVSLLEDARRDIKPAVVEASLARYAAATGEQEHALRAQFALYGAQRNAKILGIFARLHLRDDKPRYLGLIPRVWGHFLRDLSHADLAPLKHWAREYLTDEDIAVITQSDLAERAYA